MQRFDTSRGAIAVWRQAGEATVAATLAPRESHRRMVSRGAGARLAAVAPAVAGGFKAAWARNSNTIVKVP